jgi:flagellar basal body P-ring formation protein FlgA
MVRLLLVPLLALALARAAAPSAGAAELPGGEPLTREFVAALLEAELRARGEGERFAVEIDQPRLPLPNRAAQPATVAVAGLAREPRGGRLTATLDVRLPTGEAGAVAVAGRARRLVEAAVPARRVERGTTLSAEDLEPRWVDEAQLAEGAVLDAADLVGRESRRALPAGRPVRAADLGAPRLVLRGEPVTLVYASGGLEISAAGEALDAAGEGEIVRVLNPAGGTVRKGVVVGRRLVRALAAGGAGDPS